MTSFFPLGLNATGSDFVLVSDYHQRLTTIGIGIPDACGLVFAASDDPVSVWAERDRGNAGLVPLSTSGSPEPSAFQMRAVVSPLPVTSFFPLGLNATEMTSPLCPLEHAPVAGSSAFQMRAVVSALPVTTVFPSGLNATERTVRSCPFSTSGAPEASAFQIRTVPSMLPVKSSLRQN